MRSIGMGVVLFAGLGAVPGLAQGTSSAPADRALALIRSLDRPVPSIAVGFSPASSNASSSASRGVGIGVSRGGDRPAPVPPTTFSEPGSFGIARGGGGIVATPGVPATLQVGETRFIDNGFGPAREIFTGTSLTVDGLRILGDGSVEMDLELESTVPGSGPVVSSGTRLKTRVRTPPGGDAPVAGTRSGNRSETTRRGVSGGRSGFSLNRAKRREDSWQEQGIRVRATPVDPPGQRRVPRRHRKGLWSR